MRISRQNSSRGFTLVELMAALFVGLIILASATYLFSQALKASFVISQRAEMQQNGRAAVGLTSKDISLAGAGLPVGGVQLPTATGTNSKYGCEKHQGNYCGCKSVRNGNDSNPDFGHHVLRRCASRSGRHSLHG